MANAGDQTVLVTGGSGFLGGWCVVNLLQRGYNVRTTVRNLAREPEVRSMVGSEVDPGGRLSVLAADLTSDDGWAEAVTGCDYVLHVASPFPSEQPKDPDELIVPAREGTLRVLRASLDAGAKRVVVTSSIAAVRGGAADNTTLDEKSWTDAENPERTPYTRSKTIAERAAWDLVEERGEPDRLATVNPGAILGPVLSPDLSFSLEVIDRMLKGMPGVPKLGFSFVDVRDVADLEILAMTAPEAGGERFIASNKFMWMSEVAEVLRDRLGVLADKVPKRTVPNLVVRGMSMVDPALRSITGDLGKRIEVSAEKAKTKLGWSPRPIEDTIVESAESLIQHQAEPAAEPDPRD